MSFPPYAIDMDSDLEASLDQPVLTSIEPESEWDREAWLQALSDQEEIDRLSHLAEQEVWQERLQKHPAQLSRCCTSCHYFNRDYNPAIGYAVHSTGMGVGFGDANTCSDWQSVDVTLALEALEQALATHPVSQGRHWRILRVAYRWEGELDALVQVEERLHQWQVWQQGKGGTAIEPAWFAQYHSQCWKNLGDKEQWVVWVNPADPMEAIAC